MFDPVSFLTQRARGAAVQALGVLLGLAVPGLAGAAELAGGGTETSTPPAPVTVPFNLSVLAPLDLNPGGRVRNHLTLGLIFSRTDQLHGLELGAGFGLVNEELIGAQINAVGSWTAGPARGAQISAVLNYADQMTGAQVATINLASELEGAQVGVVNWATDGRGFQLGVVNLSEELEGEAVGVFSWSRRRGVFDAEVWSADTGLVNAGLRFGTEHIYNVFFVSAAPLADTSAWAPGYGLGVHLPLSERFSLDLDLTMQAPNLHERLMNGETPDVLYGLRVVPAYQLTDTLAVFAGPSINVLHDAGLRTASTLVPGHAWQIGGDGPDADDRVDLWFGAVLGLRMF